MTLGPKDHYISRVYLKGFCNSSNKVWVYNKKYLGIKEMSRKTICHERGRSDNRFFDEPRLIEKFLAPYENGWLDAVEVFSRQDQVTVEEYYKSKKIFSGYIAYLKLFPPAVSRVGQAFLGNIVLTQINLMKKRGELPPPPKGLEYLEDQLVVNVDEKFPLALGLTALNANIEKLYNSAWIRLVNNTEIPFVTSDNPACAWFKSNDQFAILYIPISPNIGILINPYMNELDVDGNSEDGTLFATLQMVNELNELVCRCAEKIVISNTKSDELSKCLQENKDWSYENVETKFDTGDGYFQFGSWRAIKK